MQQQLTELRKEIEKMKQSENATQESKRIVEYYTDEKELAEETEWIRVKNRNTKKRKLNNTPTPPHRKQSDAPIVRRDVNKKTPLTSLTSPDKRRTPMPPPVIVDIKNYEFTFMI